MAFKMKKLLYADDDKPYIRVYQADTSLRMDLNELRDKSLKLFNDLYDAADRVGGTLPDILTPIKRFLSPQKY